jgi:dienelactone hydrolase
MCEIGQMDELRWVGEAGGSERRFQVLRDGNVVPGVLWLPEEAEGSLPVVLLGHGGSGHKLAGRQVTLGRWFAGEAGIAAAAIDGPYHGERVAEPMSPAEYQKRMAEDGVDRVTDGMVDDWGATVDVLVADGLVDRERVGYFGLSLGTRFGLPFVAVRRTGEVRDGPAGGDAGGGGHGVAVRGGCAQGSVPVLFHVQWDDENFSRAGQLELFDLLGSPDKQLIAFPGPHGGAAPAAVEAWCDFLVGHVRT